MKKVPLYLIIFFILLSGASAAEITAADLDDEINYINEICEYIHSHPELSKNEKETSKIITEELLRAGFTVTENIGGYGILGVLDNGKGPIIAVRGAMDALPVTEATGLSYASAVRVLYDGHIETGVMHSSGNDIQSAVLIGLARVLSNKKNLWKGTLIIIAQPAKEVHEGAKLMIDDGIFTRFPKPDYIIGQQITNAPSTVVYCASGDVLSAEASLEVVINGYGASSAEPDLAIDPVMLSAEVARDVQLIITRDRSPLKPSSIVIGAIYGGAKENIIPEKVTLRMDLRAEDREALNEMVKSVKRVTDGLARSARVPEELRPVYDVKFMTPSLYCDPDLAKKAAKTLRNAFGEKNVFILNGRLMQSDDFAYYTITKEKVPALYIIYGCIDPLLWEESAKNKIALPPVNNPRFAPDMRSALRSGLAAVSAVALDLFNFPYNK